jgi:hypothetical protein
MIEYSEYKGYPIIKVTAANSKTSIRFGTAKAMAILAHIDEIRAWVEQQNADELMHDVTCPDCGAAWVWAADMPEMPYAPKEFSADARCPMCKDADHELSVVYPLAGVEIVLDTPPLLPANVPKTTPEKRAHERHEHRAELRMWAHQHRSGTHRFPVVHEAYRLPAVCGPTTSPKKSGLILAPGTMPGSAVKCAKQGDMFTAREVQTRSKYQGLAAIVETGAQLELKAQDFRTAEEKEQDQIKAEAALNLALPGLDNNEARKALQTVIEMKKASWQSCTVPQTEYVIKWSPEAMERAQRARATLDEFFGPREEQG